LGKTNLTESGSPTAFPRSGALESNGLEDYSESVESVAVEVDVRELCKQFAINDNDP
jgi:hypothetical protein